MPELGAPNGHHIPLWVWIGGGVGVVAVLWILYQQMQGGAAAATAPASTTDQANTEAAATSQSINDLSNAMQTQEEQYYQQIQQGQAALGTGIGTVLNGQTTIEGAQGQLLTNQAALQSGVIGLQSGQQSLLGYAEGAQQSAAAQGNALSGLISLTQSGFGGLQQSNNVLQASIATNAGLINQAIAAAQTKASPVVAAAPKSSGYSGAPGEQNNTVPAGATPTFSNQTPQIQATFKAVYGDNAQAAWESQHAAQVAKYGS